MSKLRPVRRAIGVLASSALVSGLALAATTPAGAATPAVQNVTSVTMFFKAPNPAGLQKLAAAHGLSHAQRVTALATLVPSASTRAAAVRTLTADGLTIGYQTAWSMTASGSAARIAAVFGTRPVLAGAPSLTQYLLAKGALPQLPAALRSTVSAVFPTTAGPAVLHNTAATSSLDGTDFRNADTPAGVTPSQGANDAKSTIATLQFADFYSNAAGTGGAAASKTAADLTSYATANGLTDPVKDGQYQAVPVDGGPSATDDMAGGDVEVDLDQESILSTAPSANQHAYFAPNTDAGFGDVFAAVFDDVTGDKQATAPDPNITALSSSWGECESETGSASITSIEPILESLVAAGVTTFSASGDDGIYDCRSTTGLGVENSQADVDYPASSPYVVGVGATNLSDANGSEPNTGSNWTETSWTCSSTATCESSIPLVGTGGTGGGASGSAYSSTTADSFSGFPAPAYQQVGIDDAPFAGATKRLVPDIAADGDPSTGFTLYTSNPMYVAEGGSNDVEVGGTSLATPISAAQLTNALADDGVFTGVGDIHGALYSAYRITESLKATDKTKTYRDVTVGTNGNASQMGTDPSVSAQAGYDTNTGLGGVLWSALTPYLTNTATPVTKGELTLPNLRTAKSPLSVAGTWSAAQGSDTSLIASTTITATRSGDTKPAYSATSTKGSGAFSFTAVHGSTYTLKVTSTDISGRSSTSSSTLIVPTDDTLFTFGKGWARAAAKDDVYASHANTAVKGLGATIAAYGQSFSLDVPVGPVHGELGVYLGGKLIKTIDEYNAKGGERLVPIYSTAGRTSETFTFRALGIKRAASRGAGISVDALYAYYKTP